MNWISGGVDAIQHRTSESLPEQNFPEQEKPTNEVGENTSEGVLSSRPPRLAARERQPKPMKVTIRGDNRHTLPFTLKRQLRQEQFERIKCIGRGAYGDVWVVRDTVDSAIYAMKILRKSEVIAKRQILNTLYERDLMAFHDDPWIVKLYYSFQDRTFLFYVMEYLAGGDLMNLLIRKGILNENETRFFMAEILLAIHNVHLAGFIHRDVKPDNILITKTGHIKLTDFGLSAKTENFADPLISLLKDVNEVLNGKSESQRDADPSKPRRPSAPVGTPDYIAPEVLRNRSYNQSVDFWAYGAVMYEMLFGHPPFMASTAINTARNIVRWRESLRFPKVPVVSEAAIDLIRKLLCDADDRIGFDEIKSHPFFDGIDWDHIQDMEPPYVPILDCESDCRNFEEFEPRRYDQDPGQEPAVVKAAFKCFKFNRNSAKTLPAFRKPSNHEVLMREIEERRKNMRLPGE